MKKFLFSLLFTLPLLAHADGLPDLGDVSQEVVSPQMERQIGMQSMYQIRAQKSYLDDPEITDYLNLLGERLVANSSEPSQPFEFFVLNDNSINAFALPGGFIGVHTGLIQLAENESQLASVLSHEISHVTQHHIARMISGQQYDSLATMAAMAVAILAARNNPDMASAAIIGAQGGAEQRQLNFTRANEKEADRIGMGLLEKSGFDTRAMPAFFERMQKATQIQEGDTPSWLRTHPLTVERIADVENRVQQTPFKLVPDSLDFQLMRARINAMEKSPSDAVAFFKSALGEQRFGNPVAQRYGLVLALLRDNQDVLAFSEYDKLSRQAPPNAAIAALGGKIKRQKHDKDVLAFYRKALDQFPGYHALVYDYADALLQDQQYQNVLKLLDEQIFVEGDNAKLYELQARAYAALDRQQESHHMLAYYQILHGNLRAAVEQLELAKRAGNDYYQLSTIETELRQYREILDAQRKKSKAQQ